MKRKPLNSIIFTTAIAIIFSSCNFNGNEEKVVQLASIEQQQPKVDVIIKDWPETSKKMAKEMLSKYGQPLVAANSHIVWVNTGPWKRTIVYKEEVPHHFPKKHTDVLEQTIDYQYPTDKYDEMVSYDGSVSAQRTKGELTAMCDKEAMNFLALNLANDIAKGNKTVEEARMEYARTVMEFMDGKKPKYTQGFVFTLPKGDQRDPGESIMDKVMAKEKTKSKTSN